MMILDFTAIVLTALIFVPSGAHVFELLNKLPLAQEQYLTVQAIYRGWAWFGIAIIAAIAANLARTVVLRRQQMPFWLAVVAFLLLCASLTLFFVWVFPVNQTTANWTRAPANWQALRRQWEYGHAANAALVLLAFCAVTWSALLRRSS